MPENLPQQPDGSPNIVIYHTADGRNHIQVRVDVGSVWLSQQQIAVLFETSKQNVSLHLKNIFKEGELDEKQVVKEYLTTAADGKNYKTKFFSLDAILAIGYRVRSPRGVQFRQWATENLREFIIKGFVLDDERLKGRDQVGDHFEELLARIREIRASEKRVYQRVREIFSLAADYVEGEQETQLFFATMQNKMHFAATGLTAAEIVRSRADATQPMMGLTSWSGGRVLKRDVGIAKNYLNEEEIDTLNRIVVMFLDQAEFRARRRQDIKMRDWETYLDKFLTDTELPVLQGSGRVSHEAAMDWANAEYGTFSEQRRLEAEQAAETRYLEDLRSAAETLEDGRKKRKPRKKKSDDEG